MIQFTNNAIELFLLAPIFVSVAADRICQLVRHIQAVKKEAAVVEAKAARIFTPAVRDVAAAVTKETDVVWKAVKKVDL